MGAQSERAWGKSQDKSTAQPWIVSSEEWKQLVIGALPDAKERLLEWKQIASRATSAASDHLLDTPCKLQVPSECGVDCPEVRLEEVATSSHETSSVAKPSTISPEAGSDAAHVEDANDTADANAMERAKDDVPTLLANLTGQLTEEEVVKALQASYQATLESLEARAREHSSNPVGTFSDLASDSGESKPKPKPRQPLRLVDSSANMHGGKRRSTVPTVVVLEIPLSPSVAHSKPKPPAHLLPEVKAQHKMPQRRTPSAPSRQISTESQKETSTRSRTPPQENLPWMPWSMEGLEAQALPLGPSLAKSVTSSQRVIPCPDGWSFVKPWNISSEAMPDVSDAGDTSDIAGATATDLSGSCPLHSSAMERANDVVLTLPMQHASPAAFRLASVFNDTPLQSKACPGLTGIDCRAGGSADDLKLVIDMAISQPREAVCPRPGTFGKLPSASPRSTPTPRILEGRQKIGKATVGQRRNRSIWAQYS